MSDSLSVTDTDVESPPRRQPVMRAACGWEETAPSVEQLIRLFHAHRAHCPEHGP